MKSFFAPHGAHSPWLGGLAHTIFAQKKGGVVHRLTAIAFAVALLPRSALALGGIDSKVPCVCDDEFYQSQESCETAYTDTTHACIYRYGRGLKGCLLAPLEQFTECSTDVRNERRFCEQRAETDRLNCLGEAYAEYETCLGSGVCK